MTVFNTLKELINPNWVHHVAVPPLEAGLRPNDLLDRAEVLVEGFDVDDLVVHGGSVVLTHGRELRVLEGDRPRLLTTFDSPVTALASAGQTLLAAVQGTGIVEVQTDGTCAPWHNDPQLLDCVTAMHGLPGGDIVVAIGSARYSYDEWRHAVVRGDRTGSVLRLGSGGSSTLADGLGWPAGVCERGDGDLLVSVSNEYRIDLIPLAGGKRSTLLGNLPGFPGRISALDGNWLVAFPYVRNRLSELLLEDREFVDAMVSQIEPSEWLLPQLRTENPYRSALQLGQLRVLGVLKPWAPARTYGLVALLDGRGRFSQSLQSRVDGHQHGITAAVSTADGVVVAVCGSRNLAMVKESLE